MGHMHRQDCRCRSACYEEMEMASMMIMRSTPASSRQGYRGKIGCHH